MANQLQFIVPNLAGLAALVTGTGFSAVVTDIAAGGTFIWNASNLSMQVTNNPGQGTYVAPSSDPTGASGAWVRQNTTVPGLTGINSGGPTNINTLMNPPLVGDGVTSNVPSFLSLAPILQGVNNEMPVPVNITVGSPTVLSLDPTAASGGTLPNPTIHFLKPNQAFYFILSAGGSLPAGISLNTLYYIRAGTQGVDGITPTTFTFSAVNNYGITPSNTFTSEGAAVNTTGSLTGTLSIVLTGRDVNLFIPPGSYFGGNFGSAAINVAVTPNGMSRIRYFAYGASFDTKTSFGVVGGNVSCILDAKTWALGPFDLVNTTPNDNNQPVNVDGLITLQTPANAANYYVGQWLSVFGLNIQDSFGTPASGPPNCQYQEFKKIKAINVGTGVLTLDGPLKWAYLSTFPQLFTPHSVFVAGGAASISPMHPAWDCEIEIRGARWVGQPPVTSARRVVYDGCTFQGYANAAAQAAPSVAQSYVYRNCTWGPDGAPGLTYMEIDKMLGNLEIDNCYSDNKYRLQFTSPSLQICNINKYRGSAILGTPRQIAVTNSELDSVLVGPFIGVTDACDIENTSMTYFDMQARSDDPVDLLTNAVSLRPGNDMTLVPNWSFSNGTFSRDISSLPGSQGMLWQIPGAKLYMVDAGGVFKPGQNMGAPFAILNPRLVSGVFSFDTHLRAVPTRQTSSNVTITVASPSVVTWASHGLAAGTPVVFTNTGASSAVTISLATPGLVSWTAHGLQPGMPVNFSTTGALPTGLSTSAIYYVANDGNFNANQFAVSTTQAGALAGTGRVATSGSQSGTQTATAKTLPVGLLVSTAYYVTNDGNLGVNTFAVSDTQAHALAGTGQINTVNGQSGTHTAWGNPLCFRPHPCTRFTSIGNRGSTNILALNGAIDEPLFSRWNGAFVGKQQTTNPTGFQVPLPKIWGYLKSLIVIVRQPGVASGTLTISCPGFVQGNPPTLVLSNFSQVIDTTVAGTRSWVGSAAPTGSAGADSISAYADWVSGPLVFTWSAGVTLPNSAEIEIEMRTDQGITRYSNMIGAPGTPSAGFTWQYTDSGIVQQFGSTP